jgi:hypothetical protein
VLAQIAIGSISIMVTTVIAGLVEEVLASRAS